MNETEFNLLDEPWIRVVNHTNSNHEISSQIRHNIMIAYKPNTAVPCHEVQPFILYPFCYFLSLMMPLLQ